MLQGYESSQPLGSDKLQSINDDDQDWLNDSECVSLAVFHVVFHADLTALLRTW